MKCAAMAGKVEPESSAGVVFAAVTRFIKPDARAGVTHHFKMSVHRVNAAVGLDGQVAAIKMSFHGAVQPRSRSRQASFFAESQAASAIGK